MQQSTVFQPHNHGPNEGTHRQAKSNDSAPTLNGNQTTVAEQVGSNHDSSHPQAKPPSELPARYHMLNHTRSRRMRSVRDQSSFTRFDADERRNTVPATPTVPHEMMLNQLVFTDRTVPSQDRKTTTFNSRLDTQAGSRNRYSS